jgi:hypothetical protein
MTQTHVARAALLLFALAGCDKGADAPRNVTRITVDESAYVGRLRAMTQQNRDIALRRAIHDSAQKCKRIDRSRELGTYKNMSMWTAHCDSGEDWAIFIAPAGDVQVRSCGHVAQLGLPTCATGKPAT